MSKKKRQRRTAQTIRTQAPNIRTQDAPIEDRVPQTRGPDLFWPEGQAMPTHAPPHRELMPCPKCRRIRLDTPPHRQAVVMVNAGRSAGRADEDGKRERRAGYQCGNPNCRHRWSLPVQAE